MKRGPDAVTRSRGEMVAALLGSPHPRRRVGGNGLNVNGSRPERWRLAGWPGARLAAGLRATVWSLAGSGARRQRSVALSSSVYRLTRRQTGALPRLPLCLEELVMNRIDMHFAAVHGAEVPGRESGHRDLKRLHQGVAVNSRVSRDDATEQSLDSPGRASVTFL